MKDIIYYENALSFIRSTFRKIDENTWSENLCLLIKDFLNNYELEELVNLSTYYQLKPKQQFDFAVLLLKTVEKDSSKLPTFDFCNNTQISLIEKANLELSQKSPIDFEIVTLYNSNGYNVGAYAHDDVYYYISFETIHYEGTWKTLEKEFENKLDSTSFDIHFINGNKEFTLQGKNFGITLNWPWAIPYTNKKLDVDILVQGFFKKGIYPQLDEFIRSYQQMVINNEIYMSGLP